MSITISLLLFSTEMFYRLIVITLIIGGISSIPTNQISQSRNAVIEFREMVTKVTGRSAFDFLGYGCHCGLGGKGKPVDKLDTCCQIHDQCYANTSTYLQFWNLCSPHLVGYSWTFDNGTVTCTGNKDTCGYKTCMCDKIVAECFAQNTYNNQFKGYSQGLCA
jgi:secretory phospholipase A2